jgi:hypothetical protein
MGLFAAKYWESPAKVAITIHEPTVCGWYTSWYCPWLFVVAVLTMGLPLGGVYVKVIVLPDAAGVNEPDTVIVLPATSDDEAGLQLSVGIVIEEEPGVSDITETFAKA